MKRQIIEGLRPSTLSMLGLQIALETLCTETSQHLGIVISQDIDQVQISPEAELSLFRVAQEALANIGKHAAATEVFVRLKQENDGVRLQIVDNGSGFEVETAETGRHGLAGMRFRMERHGGMLSVVSSAQQGTRIIANLPLSAGMELPLAHGGSRLAIRAQTHGPGSA